MSGTACTPATRLAWRWLGLAAASLLAAAAGAQAQALEPFKDQLFAYPAILESRDGGALLRVDYNEMRDINGRDEIVERRVKRAYVATRVNRSQQALTITADGRGVDVYQIGAQANARFTIIFIHGRGGDRRLGADDWTFGGNFNRLKNLAADNGGTYYVPSVARFDESGAADITGLLRHVASVSPGAPIVMACGSMGAFICHALARDAQVAPLLSGLVFLGGSADGGLLDSTAISRGVPVLFAHGSRDSVYPAENQIALFDRLRAARPGYRARFVLFETGSHGTPIRMIDWRDTLNWILAR